MSRPPQRKLAPKPSHPDNRDGATATSARINILAPYKPRSDAPSKAQGLTKRASTQIPTQRRSPKEDAVQSRIIGRALSEPAPYTMTGPAGPQRSETLYNSTKTSMQRVMSSQSNVHIASTSRDLCERLRDLQLGVPADRIPAHDTWGVAYYRGGMPVRSISQLEVPALGSRPPYICEGVNGCWDRALIVNGPRPRPDYSLGYHSFAFKESGANKVMALTGGKHSCFTATDQMYFPFLACEAGICNPTMARNAATMSFAVTGLVSLYKLVNREEELNHKILGFSVSYNNHRRTVQIQGHYPVIQQDNVLQRAIYDGTFSTDDEMTWTICKFIRNVYLHFVAPHLSMILSVLDDLSEKGLQPLDPPFAPHGPPTDFTRQFLHPSSSPQAPPRHSIPQPVYPPFAPQGPPTDSTRQLLHLPFSPQAPTKDSIPRRFCLGGDVEEERRRY
ncbi:MAG: hypothetical protein Q9163_004320 [Psora crenata]